MNITAEVHDTHVPVMLAILILHHVALVLLCNHARQSDATFTMNNAENLGGALNIGNTGNVDFQASAYFEDNAVGVRLRMLTSRVISKLCLRIRLHSSMPDRIVQRAWTGIDRYSHVLVH